MVFIKRKQINSRDLTDGLEHWCTVLRYSTSMAWKPLSKANMTPMTPIIFTSGFLHQEANALNHAFLYSVLLSSIYSINLIQLLNWTNCATVKKCSESDECQLLSDTKEIVTIYGPPSNIKWHFIIEPLTLVLPSASNLKGISKTNYMRKLNVKIWRMTLTDECCTSQDCVSVT